MAKGARMATDTLDEEVAALSELEPGRKISSKKLILFGILPLLVLAGGGAALYVTGVLDSLLGSSAEEVEAEPDAGQYVPGIYYEIPDVLVNLASDGGRSTVLKISISLELESAEARARIDQWLPRIIDNFQVYLRELTLEDLRGSAGLHRLREELLRRVSLAAGTDEIRDVLFREMLLQ